MNTFVRVGILLAGLTWVFASAHAWVNEGRSTLYGDPKQHHFGNSVSGAGDVNGDGYDDIIVGGTWEDGYHADNHGSARVYSGKDGRLLHAFAGEDRGDFLGNRVSGAGDVNADGYDDVIAAAHRSDGNGEDSGSVFVYSGKDGSTLYTFHGESAGDYFGSSVSRAGDVNGDGYADVIVGSIRNARNGKDAGSATVLSGADGSVLYTFYGGAASDRFGCSVANAGDLNADGYDDVIVGARGDTGIGSDAGSAKVFSGKDGEVIYTFRGRVAGDAFGIAVSGAGDVDRDGYPDLIIGARLGGMNGSQTGSASVFSGKDGKVLRTFYGQSKWEDFGAAVSGAGDFNGDAYDDVIVGCPNYDNESQSAGFVRVYSGKDWSPLCTFYGGSFQDRLGGSVGAAGDFDGDGYSDIVVGAGGFDGNGHNTGAAFVYTGTPVTGTVVIDSGAEYSNSSSVTLDLTWDGAGQTLTEMRVRNAGDGWGHWIAAATPTSWTLPTGDGDHVVESQFRTAGDARSHVVTDRIILDGTAPTVDLAIDDGNDHTGVTTVTLDLSASDSSSGVADMRARTGGAAAWHEWRPFESTMAWVLTAGEGENPVEVQVRDVAGNVSAVGYDTIFLDRTPPRCAGLVIDEDWPYVAPRQEIEFRISASNETGGAGVDAFKVSFDGGASFSGWNPLDGSSRGKTAWPAVDGLLIATVIVRDAVGNEGTGFDAPVYLIENNLIAASGGGKLAGSISSGRDVDGIAVGLVAGDQLTVKLKAKPEVEKQAFELALDLVTPDGQRLVEGRFPSVWKKPMIRAFVAPSTGQYLVIVRRDTGDAEIGTYSLNLKVKQAKTTRKGKGIKPREILLDAADGAVLRVTLSGTGLTAGSVSLEGPAGPVAFLSKEKSGTVKILPTILDAGTGTYRIRVPERVDVTYKWALKLPAKVKRATVP